MRKSGLSDRSFDTINVLLLIVISLICILPFLQIVAGSFATQQELMEKKFVLIPEVYSLDAYRFIFSDITIPKSMMISVFITVCGTIINLVFTSITAFALARRGLRGRRFIMFLIVFTLLFDGGMIPAYLVVKELGLINTYWAVMIPNAISAFNLILMRNFFMSLPEELFESAKIDGCNDLKTFIQIVIPLSMASMATFMLFYAVNHWNNFMMPFLYLNTPDMWPVQIWLRQIIIMATADFGDFGASIEIPSQSLRMATIVVATLPILLVYPFIQKHFVKGVMIGSVKG
ncbi:carbohydrate ABC transporter permease [Paenibacillus sp. PL2-23]|uniref:carbohydrate ABC transporter permease n=1 Tax=Paenibacillus sp. PL2-23 TaxID=2100729 RepID=UPI0030FA8B20